MQKRHADLDLYFREQGLTTAKYVIPYLQTIVPVTAELRVAEIGCGEAGNLQPFLALGCTCVGIDIDAYKIDKGRKLLAEYIERGKLNLVIQDIYQTTAAALGGPFDLIILRDVIEHIPHQEVFMAHLKQFLTSGGRVFFGFPPWRMPFGGHQQAGEHRWLSKLPYFHLLPESLYLGLWRWGGEAEGTVKAFKDIRDTRIGIHRFRRMIQDNGFHTDRETLYLINPNYDIKFGLKPRRLPFFLNLPWIRDFFTTAVYAVISHNPESQKKDGGK